MEEKRVYFICTILIMTCFILLLVFILNDRSEVVGRSVFGTVTFSIINPSFSVVIESPKNQTYSFALGEELQIPLNVTTTGGIAQSWWYTLRDATHGNYIVNDSVSFLPNTTLYPVRKSNNLTVYANDSGGNVASSNVIFYVLLPNSAPLIRNAPTNVYICEGDSFSYDIDVMDIDEDILFSDISPKNPFFIAQPVQNLLNLSAYSVNIYSGHLFKDSVGVYNEELSINDGVYSDSANIEITVIEINNDPSIETIGSRTLYSKGDNSNFIYQVNVNDKESGNASSGNFSFTLDFKGGKNLFNISSYGEMRYNASIYDLGAHIIELCITDKPLAFPHRNSSICINNGSANTVCETFSLTITNENRPPTIKSYYPQNLNLSVLGNELILFNISSYDPDGNIPDTYWYVDNNFYYGGTLGKANSLNYSFGCDVSGMHQVRVEITDGLLNDSITWNLSVAKQPCPMLSGGSGGGGGSVRGEICFPSWGCDDWGVCQNSEKSLEIGVLSGEDYRKAVEQCRDMSLTLEDCGVQIRVCSDLNSCNITGGKPEEFQGCYYTKDPSCNDGIKNCHDGLCEFLVDCGGPCGPCPTCSDNKQNQGEFGIDCGGPCPVQCKAEIPSKLLHINKLVVAFVILIIILMVVIIIKLFRIIALKRVIKRHSNNLNS